MSPPQPRSDAELATQLRAGDTDALGQLYERHVGGIHDYLARFTCDPAAGRTSPIRPSYGPWEGRSALRDPSKVRACLYATAHHLALNHVTRSQPAASIDDAAAGRIADSARGPEEGAMAQAAAELVWAAASSLEARQLGPVQLPLSVSGRDGCVAEGEALA